MRGSKALSPLAAGFILVAISTEALATPEEDVKQAPRRHRTSEILMRMEEPRGDTASWLESVAVRKGVGLVYRREFQTDESKLVLNVGGPVLRGVGDSRVKRKHLGLMFEVKF
jgi:hypothetical protein